MFDPSLLRGKNTARVSGRHLICQNALTSQRKQILLSQALTSISHVKKEEKLLQGAGDKKVRERAGGGLVAESPRHVLKIATRRHSLESRRNKSHAFSKEASSVCRVLSAAEVSHRIDDAVSGCACVDHNDLVPRSIGISACVSGTRPQPSRRRGP